jgi:hypothetical protein
VWPREWRSRKHRSPKKGLGRGGVDVGMTRGGVVFLGRSMDRIERMNVFLVSNSTILRFILPILIYVL